MERAAYFNVLAYIYLGRRALPSTREALASCPGLRHQSWQLEFINLSANQTHDWVAQQNITGLTASVAFSYFCAKRQIL